MSDQRDGGAADRLRQSPPAPYRTTPVFDENSLPKALRHQHSTKADVWGVIRLLEGKLRLVIVDPPAELILTKDRPGLLLPEQLHFVEPLGRMKMQVEFFRQHPGPQ